MALTYGDDVFAEVMARSQDWVKWPWTRTDLNRDHDRELHFLTYLNVVSSSDSVIQDPQPCCALQPKFGGKGLKSVSFSTRLEEVRNVDPALLDYKETHGIKVDRGRGHDARIRDTPNQEQVYTCSCSGRTCSGKPMTAIFPTANSPIQWLPIVPSLESNARSWIRRIKWTELAAWESAVMHEEVCRSVTLGYHFWLLRDGAENISGGICRMYNRKLFELGSAIDGFITGLKVLSQLELIQPGAIDMIAENPSHYLQELVRRLTGHSLDVSLRSTFESRTAMNRLLKEVALVAEALCTEIKELKGLALAIQEDMSRLGDVLGATADTPVCSERFGQVNGLLENFTSSLDLILGPIVGDAAWLLHSPEAQVGHETVAKNFSAIERLVTSAEVLLVKMKTMHDRVREWDRVLGDTRYGYRKLGM